MFALVLVVFSVQAVKADYSFSISDEKKEGWIGEVPMYGLFNDYFGTTYGSSNEVLTDRGYIVSNDWIALPGAQIYGAYKVAGLAHELNFISEDGQTLMVQSFEGNTQTWGIDTSIIGGALQEGVFSMVLETFWYGDHVGTVWADGAEYTTGSDNEIHMVAIDVTDLMQGMLDYDITSAYFFSWEDMLLSVSDYDYQDLAYIMVNVRHGTDTNVTTATPEPATALILLAGLAACPLVRKLRRKQNG